MLQGGAGSGVTTMVFTLNEEIHLPFCLESLQWCDDVIVIDSYSRDRTEAIARDRGARFFQHKFEGFGSQRNWALDHAEPRYPWVLILDADERVPPELGEEIKAVAHSSPQDVGAYRARRRFHIWGRWLRYSALYPTWVVRLVHREKVRYQNRGHAETEEVDGRIGELQNDLIDENIKGIDKWFDRQNRYALKEAKYELDREKNESRLIPFFEKNPFVRRESLKALARRMPGRGFWYFVYGYFFRGGFLEGNDGFVFCLMKGLYQQMIALHKVDLQRRERGAGS